MNRLLALTGLTLVSVAFVRGQVIEFESSGLKYQTLTKSRITVIFAPLPAQISDYSIVQVSVSNGSAAPYVIRPEDFSFVRADGGTLRGVPSKDVVSVLYRKGSGSDVIKLITTYETAVYGTQIRSTNGYEQRRQGALAMSSNKVRAAATASALALVQTKLAPGESTDGAVFFTTLGKPLGPGRLIVRTNTDTFEFNPSQ